jgi:hypothetical protein
VRLDLISRSQPALEEFGESRADDARAEASPAMTGAVTTPATSQYDQRGGPLRAGNPMNLHMPRMSHELLQKNDLAKWLAGTSTTS